MASNTPLTLDPVIKQSNLFTPPQRTTQALAMCGFVLQRCLRTSSPISYPAAHLTRRWEGMSSLRVINANFLFSAKQCNSFCKSL